MATKKKENKIPIPQVQLECVGKVNGIIEQIKNSYPLCSSGFASIKVVEDASYALYVKVFRSQTQYKVCFKLCDIHNKEFAKSDEIVYEIKDFNVSYIELMTPLLMLLV